MRPTTPRDFLIDVQRHKLSRSARGSAAARAPEGRQNVLDLNLLIGVDVSGSISASQFAQFMRQIEAIRGLSRVRVIETDTTVQAMYDYFATPERKRVVRLSGGGGTDFTVFFQVAREIQPDAILFMTDGFVGGAPKAPTCPVGWILTRDGVKPYGFGEIVGRLGEPGVSGTTP